MNKLNKLFIMHSSQFFELLSEMRRFVLNNGLSYKNISQLLVTNISGNNNETQIRHSFIDLIQKIALKRVLGPVFVHFYGENDEYGAIVIFEEAKSNLLAINKKPRNNR